MVKTIARVLRLGNGESSIPPHQIAVLIVRKEADIFPFKGILVTFALIANHRRINRVIGASGAVFRVSWPERMTHIGNDKETLGNRVEGDSRVITFSNTEAIAR
ncbi:MAG: hypothetical protein ACRD98_08705 [Nitrososphaera sp.]